MLALKRFPLDSSRQPIALERISIPAMSRCMASRWGAGLGSRLMAAVRSGAFSRSSKLVLPSLRLTRSAVSPDRVTRLTTTCLENSGKSASDILASSKRAKIPLPSGSDRDVLPTAMPMLGKKVRARLPSIASVRPVLSLTAAAISGLCLLGSKVAATMAITSTISATRPPATRSRVLRTFKPASRPCSSSQGLEDFQAGLRFLFVGDPERHMAGRDVAARRLDVAVLVVEKNIRAESLQERALVQPTQKQ